MQAGTKTSNIRKIAVLALALALLGTLGCGKKSQQSQSANAPTVTTDNGLKIKDIKIGTGAQAVNGSTVSISYVGKLDDGTVFDATGRHNNQPLDFTIGSGQVIPGMEQGVIGMQVGGKREIVIPPELGYGEDDMGQVPPDSTLHFTVTLLAVK